MMNFFKFAESLEMQFEDIALIFSQDDDARRILDEATDHDLFVSEIFYIIKTAGVLKNEPFNPGIGAIVIQPARRNDELRPVG